MPDIRRQMNAPSEDVIIHVTYRLRIPARRVAWITEGTTPKTGEWYDRICDEIADNLPDALDWFIDGEPDVEPS